LLPQHEGIGAGAAVIQRQYWFAATCRPKPDPASRPDIHDEHKLLGRGRRYCFALLSSGQFCLGPFQQVHKIDTGYIRADWTCRHALRRIKTNLVQILPEILQMEARAVLGMAPNDQIRCESRRPVATKMNAPFLFLELGSFLQYKEDNHRYSRTN